jgi:hypothetical protein
MIDPNLAAQWRLAINVLFAQAALFSPPLFKIKLNGIVYSVLAQTIPVPGMTPSQERSECVQFLIDEAFAGRLEFDRSGLSQDPEMWLPTNKVPYEVVGDIVMGSVTSKVKSEPAVAVNDHTCPTCKNNRCSRSEVNCWKCGNKL